MKNKSILLLVILIVISLLAVGCQGTTEVADPTNSPVASATVTPTPTPEPTIIEFTDSMGRVTQFDETPATVISLSPTLTEIVYALDLGDKVVGRTDWCDYPSQVFDIQSVGNMDVPSFETIITINPDVVIVSLVTTEDTVNKLEEAGIKCVVIDNETTFEGAYANISMVGDLLGATDTATTTITTMKADVDEITATLGDSSPKTTYYIMGYGEYGDFTAGAGTFISDMIKLAGGINVADDTTDWSYSVEQLVDHNPDVLICSMWAPAEGLKEATGYMDLDAVKNDKVYTIEDNLMQRIGPRITEGLKEVAKALHPELFE